MILKTENTNFQDLIDLIKNQLTPFYCELANRQAIFLKTNAWPISAFAIWNNYDDSRYGFVFNLSNNKISSFFSLIGPSFLSNNDHRKILTFCLKEMIKKIFVYRAESWPTNFYSEVGVEVVEASDFQRQLKNYCQTSGQEWPNFWLKHFSAFHYSSHM